MIKKLWNYFRYPVCLLEYYGACFLSLFVRNTAFYKDLWLISERKKDARDNGWHFFRYVRNCHPETNIVYVIDRKSPDYEKVRAIGTVLQPGTLRHTLAFVSAKIHISTHLMGPAPDTYRYAILDRHLHIIKNKKALIRHGIAGITLSELFYPKARVDLLVCTTKMEYAHMTKEYGHPDGVVQRLGLCRLDRLGTPHPVKRQILIMPTWRYFLRKLSPEDFKKSQYYQNISGLLNNERFLKLLEDYDVDVKLYLHFELQPYSLLFEKKSDRIHLTTMQDADVQDLLMESAFLITDYSSVYFDFAYMKKPLLYWQFDEELYYSTQYKRGIFSCRDDGFGPVFDTDDQEPVVDFLEEEAKLDFAIKPEYEQRVRRCFDEPRFDHCEQTYNAILKLLEKR